MSRWHFLLLMFSHFFHRKKVAVKNDFYAKNGCDMNSAKCHPLIDSYHFCTFRKINQIKTQKIVKHTMSHPLSDSYYFGRFSERKSSNKWCFPGSFLAPIWHILAPLLIIWTALVKKNSLLLTLGVDLSLSVPSLTKRVLSCFWPVAVVCLPHPLCAIDDQRSLPINVLLFFDYVFDQWPWYSWLTLSVVFLTSGHCRSERSLKMNKQQNYK